MRAQGDQLFNLLLTCLAGKMGYFEKKIRNLAKVVISEILLELERHAIGTS
jgi:hypothetical protein